MFVICLEDMQTDKEGVGQKQKYSANLTKTRGLAVM